MAEQEAPNKETTEPEGQVEQTKEEETKTAEQKLEETMKQKEEAPKEEGADPDKKEETALEITDDWKPKLPEGMILDEAVFKEAKDLLKEMKLSPDNAQKLTDYQIKIMQDMQETTYRNWQNKIKEWDEGIKNDPEFKDNFDKKKAVADLAYNEFFTADERDYLTKLGVSSYLFRALYKVGLKVAEPQTVPSGTASGQKAKYKDSFEGLTGLFGETKN